MDGWKEGRKKTTSRKKEGKKKQLDQADAWNEVMRFSRKSPLNCFLDSVVWQMCIKKKCSFEKKNAVRRNQIRKEKEGQMNAWKAGRKDEYNNRKEERKAS